jgi:hypothetical protein
MKEKRHYTNQERHKIYTAPKVKLKNVPFLPKGKDVESYRCRKSVILKGISLIKEPIYCPALNAQVSLKRKGMDETLRYASMDKKSTLYALNLEQLLNGAVYICDLEPHSKFQQSFLKMHLLICPVSRYGYAKIIVGEYYKKELNKPNYTHYCVSKISLNQIKK